MSNVSGGSVRDSDGDGEPDMAEDSRALQTHETDTSNPHSVTDDQTGAASALSNHEADESNPHNVTDDQTGAASALSNHESNGTAHHSPPAFASETSTLSVGTGDGTVTVSFSNIYTNASPEVGLTESTMRNYGSQMWVTWTGWQTDANGNITGMHLAWRNKQASGHPVRYQVMGVIA